MPDQKENWCLDRERTACANALGPEGRGLNSLPVRFALMTAVVGAIGFALQCWLVFAPQAPLGPWQKLFVGATICLPAVVTWLAARRLAGMIAALRRATLAILDGTIDMPVDADRACEIGGLADSFRAMVARLNGNILRMNILAYTDSVTGLPNRAVINHVLDLLRGTGPDGGHGSMFFIDLDGFKRVNDTFGHDAGDELLRLASLRIVEQGFGVSRDSLDACTTVFGELCATAPEQLVFARFAGDEFVGLLPGDRSRAELQAIGDRILASLDAPFDVFGNPVSIGASIGIAFDRNHDNPRELLNHADTAMYRAKGNGRNCVAFYDGDLRRQVAERAQLERDLRDALRHGRLSMHYQPKVEALTGELIGVEALVRWTHPVLGPIAPDLFVSIAEQTGSMGMLAETVLRLVARQGRAWADAGVPLPVAINVSAVQFDAPGFVDRVLATLAAEGLDPALLELEVTETVAMSASARDRIAALRSHGIRIVIDDFGTGYSNLSQLARLDFDVIKIDRSLVTGIGRNSKTEAMLAAAIEMVHALGHPVIAEGIETAAQLRFLTDLGCDQYQGFYIARPMAADEVLQWRQARILPTAADLRLGLMRHNLAA